MITCGPRHGKSSLVSQYLSAFWLGQFPDQRVMLISYEAQFAASWGGKAREILNEFGPELFGIRVSDSSSARNAWDVVDLNGRPTGGGMVASAWEARWWAVEPTA